MGVAVSAGGRVVVVLAQPWKEELAGIRAPLQSLQGGVSRSQHYFIAYRSMLSSVSHICLGINVTSSRRASQHPTLGKFPLTCISTDALCFFLSVLINFLAIAF